MKLRAWRCLSASLALTACSGVFESKLRGAAVLRAAPAAAHRASGRPPTPAACWCSGPRRARASTSERIALLRSDQRFDFYAASRWAAPAPDLIESVMRRRTARHRRCSPRCSTMRRRTRRATTCAARCAASKPTTLDRAAARPPFTWRSTARSGRHRDRELLASFTAQGSAAAGEDRLNAVVAAFEAATAAAHERARTRHGRGRSRSRKAAALRK